MNKQKTFTQEELQLLKNNHHVIKVTKHQIHYTSEFKQQAVHQYEQEGIDARSIFAEAGLPKSIINSDLPRWAIKNWRKQQGDFSDKRGRVKKRVDINTMTDTEKIVYYEAVIAFKEAENASLAEARGLKRWKEFVWEPGKDSLS